jgi:hypothetical protein
MASLQKDADGFYTPGTLKIFQRLSQPYVTAADAAPTTDTVPESLPPGKSKRDDLLTPQINAFFQALTRTLSNPRLKSR